MPPTAAATGSAARRGSRRSPATNSRLSSSPATKKKIASSRRRPTRQRQVQVQRRGPTRSAGQRGGTRPAHGEFAQTSAADGGDQQEHAADGLGAQDVADPADLRPAAPAEQGLGVHGSSIPCISRSTAGMQGAMRALTWQGTSKVSVETVPDPKIQEPTDAIVRMTSTAICGSDLHLYDVLGMYLDKGDVLGHEPMGIVEEVGPEVTHIRPGDRVVIPFNISCGHCWMCSRGFFAQCETTQVKRAGQGRRRCSATPSSTARSPAARPSTCACRRRTSARSRCRTVTPTSATCSSPTCSPPSWQAAKYADITRRRHRGGHRPRPDRPDDAPGSPATSAPAGSSRSTTSPSAWPWRSGTASR